jgi:hypothetical protein
MSTFQKEKCNLTLKERSTKIQNRLEEAKFNCILDSYQTLASDRSKGRDHDVELTKDEEVLSEYGVKKISINDVKIPNLATFKSKDFNFFNRYTNL